MFVLWQLYTLHQLCAMHEIGGLRMNRYRELGQYAFGEWLSLVKGDATSANRTVQLAAVAAIIHACHVFLVY